jgi:hypothetical protein
MVQCNLCSLSYQTEEDLANHKKNEHKPGEKVPTIVETSAQLIREQNVAHQAGKDASFGFGVGDPVAAGKTNKEESKTTKKFGEK